MQINICFISLQLQIVCAGTCAYDGTSHGIGSCTITLSQPLLQYRSNNEVKETLLHEMIHAYLFLFDLKSCRGDDGGHGQEFQALMHQLNNFTNLKITIYHTFHDEVDHARTHVWKCNGPCQQQAPYFGIVKRSMNRPPGPSDNWHEDHKRKCGGVFSKISEPPPKIKEKKQVDKKKNIKPIKNKNQNMHKQLTLDDMFGQTFGQKDKKSTQLIDNTIEKKQDFTHNPTVYLVSFSQISQFNNNQQSSIELMGHFLMRADNQMRKVNNLLLILIQRVFSTFDNYEYLRKDILKLIPEFAVTQYFDDQFNEIFEVGEQFKLADLYQELQIKTLFLQALYLNYDYNQNENNQIQGIQDVQPIQIQHKYKLEIEKEYTQAEIGKKDNNSDLQKSLVAIQCVYLNSAFIIDEDEIKIGLDEVNQLLSSIQLMQFNKQ